MVSRRRVLMDSASSKRELRGHKNDKTNPHDVIHSQLTDVSETDPNEHGNMRWQGEWVDGTYQKHDVVIDGAFTMIANKVTTDRAAPQPSGAPSFLLPDVPVWDTQQFTGTVFSGLVVNPAAGALKRVLALRIWLPVVTADATYRATLIDLNTGVLNIGSVVLGTALGAPGWLTLNIDPIFVDDSDSFAFVLESANASATTDSDFPWVYGGISNQLVDPGTGLWNRNTQHTQIRINDTDDNAVDQSAFLATIVPGTVIRTAVNGSPADYWEYSVVDGFTSVGFHYFTTTLIETGGVGVALLDLCDIFFQVPVAQPADYVRIVDEWLPFPTRDGYLSFNDLVGGTEDDNAYGVDIESQDYIDSPDWDLVAYSG